MSEQRPRVAVIVFPGSNCDRDIAVALESVTGVACAIAAAADKQAASQNRFIAAC